MKAILRIGQTGTGKSHFVKNNVINTAKNVLIFDVYKEYPDEIPVTKIENYRGGIYRVFSNSVNMDEDFEKFLYHCQFIRNTTIILEDCTSFLGANAHGTLKKLLVEKRHSNNVYFLLFHSLRRVPPFCFELSNYLILSKTNDNAREQSKRLGIPELESLVKEVKQHENPFYFKIFKIV